MPPEPLTIHQAIAHGLEDLGCPAADAAARLAAYVGLLARWNRVYNLTAVRQPEDMVPRHILDSLSILPWVRGPRLLDVGSGAGLPGIPLAVARPDLAVTCLDSNGKRTRFITQAAAELGLANVEVVRRRIEDYRPAALFDSVVGRAYATLAVLAAQAGRLCAPGGRLLAMKGRRPDDELAALPAGVVVRGVHSLVVPGLAAERHLVQLEFSRTG